MSGIGDTIPEPDTLLISMTRGERRIADELHKTFGDFKRVVIDVDGEKREFSADSFIRLLEDYEDAQGMSNYMRLFGTPERAARTLVNLNCDGSGCDGCSLGDTECNYGYDTLLEWLRGDA
jgi:hypothetical protein